MNIINEFTHIQGSDEFTLQQLFYAWRMKRRSGRRERVSDTEVSRSRRLTGCEVSMDAKTYLWLLKRRKVLTKQILLPRNSRDFYSGQCLSLKTLVENMCLSAAQPSFQNLFTLTNLFATMRSRIRQWQPQTVERSFIQHGSNTRG